MKNNLHVFILWNQIAYMGIDIPERLLNLITHSCNQSFQIIIITDKYVLINFCYIAVDFVISYIWKKWGISQILDM